jgi:hypothetical protein
MFDPYEKWLGIPVDQRPVDHYQLLDVDPDEDDLEVIQEAVDRRTAKVQRHEEKHPELCARILKEIEQAGATLFNPAKRKRYDAELRSAPAGKSARKAKEDARITAKPRRDAGKTAQSRAKQVDEDEAPAPRRLWLWLVLGGAAACLLMCGTAGGVGIWWFTRPATPPTVPVALAPPNNPEPPPAPPPAEKQPEPPKPAPPKADPEPKPAPPPTPAPPPPTKPPEPKPAPPPKAAKFPVPSAEDQAIAEKDLRALYKADYAKADKLALAAKLLQPGRENRKDPPAWYVLLREARDLAVQGNGARLAAEAIREMDQFFEVDGVALQLKALGAIGQAPNAPAAAAVAETALALASRAVDDDHYDDAGKLLATADTALSAAAKSKKQAKSVEKHVKLVEERKTQLTDLTKQHQSYVQARDKLKQAPDATDANLTVGRHLCLFHDRWDEGLPYLAKGANKALQSVAKQDLARPAAADQQLKLANAWWEQSDAQVGREQLNLRRRARFWYETASAGAPPAERTKIDQRIKQVDDAETARLTRLSGGSFYGRGLEDRVLLLREGGGTMKSEQAIERGLEWLLKHQAPSGMWSNDAFGAFCKCGDPGHKFDVAGTAFGLLPFLGVGQTHKSGPNAKAIYKGLAFLLGSQKKEGHFSDNMYENALATIVVCEAYGLTRDPQLRASAQGALAYIVRGQNSAGGWGYAPNNQKSDTSVTGWQFTALKAGVYAGLTVPPSSFEQLGRFLDTMEDPSGIGYGYNAPGAGRSTSAVGLLCREFLGWGPSYPRLIKGIKQLQQPENFPTKDKISIYFIFYATQAFHHAGGKNWEAWNPKVRDLLVELQDAGAANPHQAGSWSPSGDDFAAQGGRLMFTSLALITLEVYYYHVPLFNHGAAVLLE